MKFIFKPKKNKKSSTKSLDLCFYYTKPNYIKNKCYYKDLEYTNKNSRQKFKTQIKKVQSKANTIKIYINNKSNTKNDKFFFPRN